MMNRFVRPFATAAFLVLGALPAAAQNTVALKPVFNAGQEFKYMIGMNLEVAQQLKDKDMQKTTVRGSALAKMRVLEVAPDGALKLLVEFETVKLEAPIGDQPVGYLWPTGAPLGDDAGGDRKLGPIIGGTKVDVVVNARGQATVTGGFEEFMQAAEKLGYTDDRIMGFFTPDKFAAAITPIFKMDDGWIATRFVGAAWQNNETIALPPAAAIEIITNLQITDADSELVNYGGSMIVGLKRPTDAAEDVAEVTMERGGGGAAGSFDRRRNLLKTHKTSMGIVTDWKLGDIEMRQEQSSFMTLRLEP